MKSTEVISIFLTAYTKLFSGVVHIVAKSKGYFEAKVCYVLQSAKVCPYNPLPAAL